MAEHTPGDWFISDEGPGQSDAIRQEETGALICEFPYGAFDGVEGANAKLVAAAPKLLNAIHLFLKWNRFEKVGMDSLNAYTDALEAAAGAWLAATGENAA